MQHGAKRSFAHLIFEDAAAVVVGVAGVNDQRQAGRAGGGDVRAKAALLGLGRAVLVEIIQPRLAQGHDLGMPRQPDQFVGGHSVFLIGVVRMGADRAIDVWKPLGDRKELTEAPHPSRDGDDAPDSCSRRPGHDALEIIGEVRKIQVAVAIDQHRIPTVQAADGST